MYLSLGYFFQNLSDEPNYNIINVWVDQDGNYQRALVVNKGKFFSIFGTFKNLLFSRITNSTTLKMRFGSYHELQIFHMLK